MKQKFLLKAMLLLCALVVGSSSVWADSYTLGWGTATGAAGTYTNFTDVSGSVKDIVSFSTAKNSAGTNPAYNSTNNELRLYYHSGGSGGSVTLTPAAGVTITGAVMTTSTNPSVKYSVNGGDATSVAASGDNSPYTYTVSGISATSSLTFQNVNTSNTQLRILTIQITYTKVAVTKYTATFNVNGDEISSEDYAEGEDIVFPSDPSDIGEKKFMGWATAAIDGTTDVEPAFVTSATMGTSAVTFYAVFASQTDVAGNKTLTINKNTENFPTAYGTANTFTEYTLVGKKFKIQQGYVNGTKLQWRASGNASGTGTMYNTEVLKNIQSIVLTYDASDGSKNFTLKIGDTENPTGGTAITPSSDGSVYTFDCSTYNKKYFVLENGTGAGYLTSIAITYESYATTNVAYCTTVAVPSTVSVTIASSGYSTIASGWGLDFSSATPAGLEAYVASDLSASAVTLSAVDEAPAGTGVILKGTAGETYTIPVKADATFDGTNKLKAAVYPTGVDANSAYILKGGKFCLVTNASLVPAGKAYLLASDVPAAAPELMFVFGGEVTGVNEVSEVKEVNDNSWYNLAGQRVAQPSKGLYIVNGKKVVIK